MKTDSEILVHVLRRIDAFEEEANLLVLHGEDRALLELANSPCTRCDLSFSCWSGKELCRKRPLKR
jgi:hypothetical protein